jgi:hypothetical protein
MGFDLHITRAQSWLENEGAEISGREWLAVVASDPELLPDPSNGEYAVRWRGESTVQEPWFDWSRGNVYTSDPDRRVLQKALQLAEALGAKVQGDDGVDYTKPTDWSE